MTLAAIKGSRQKKFNGTEIHRPQLIVEEAINKIVKRQSSLLLNWLEKSTLAVNWDAARGGSSNKKAWHYHNKTRDEQHSAIKKPLSKLFN